MSINHDACRDNALFGSTMASATRCGELGQGIILLRENGDHLMPI
jgi:hypothetical protein